MASSRSRLADHRAALDLVDALAHTTTRDSFAATLLPRMATLLHSDAGSWTEVGAASPAVGMSMGMPSPNAYPELLAVWRARHREHPWVAHVLAGGEPDTLRLSDLVATTDLRRTALFHEFFAPRGVRHGVYTGIGRSTGRVVGVGAVRSGRDFSYEERQLLDRVRGAVAGILAQVTAREALEQRLGSAHVPELAALTAAERSVFDLLAQGLGNAEIADARRVSRKAVEQHLSSIYRKLGVTSRTQLLAHYAPLLGR